MAPHKTITVNGRSYDAVTGLPIDTSVKAVAPKPKPKPEPIAKKQPATPRMQQAAGAVHGGPQRSQTLNRRAAKKPTPTPRPITKRATPGRHMDIARSSSVSKFSGGSTKAAASAGVAKTAAAAAAKAPVRTLPEAPAATIASPATKAAAQKTAAKKAPSKLATRKLQKSTAAKVAAVKKGQPIKPDAPAKSHPAMQRALKRVAAKKPTPLAAKKPAPAPATAKQVKEAAIAKALAAPTKKQAAPKKRGKQNKSLRKALLITGIAVVAVFALVAAYRFIPNISVGIASRQAGINASYPEFTPDGYSLTQPVTYTEGAVALNFHSNSNKNSYTITQTRSSWDSSAVLDKIVTPEAGTDYVTTKERGLTIYTFKSKAVWVNAGILYVIDSNAELSSDQIRRIATSL